MDKSEKKDAELKTPGYKRFGGAKLVPPPAPIPQLNDEARFPVFLGVGIALSIAALITVFVLAFFSHKTKVNTAPADSGASSIQTVSATPAVSPKPKSSAGINP